MTAGRKVIADNKDWGTPKKYVDAVRECFGGSIDLDPCSNSYSIVHARVEYMLPKKDGLRESWNFPTVYVNPPYGIDRKHGKTIKDWLKKCEEAHRVHGADVLASSCGHEHGSLEEIHLWQGDGHLLSIRYASALSRKRKGYG